MLSCSGQLSSSTRIMTDSDSATYLSIKEINKVYDLYKQGWAPPASPVSGLFCVGLDKLHATYSQCLSACPFTYTYPPTACAHLPGGWCPNPTLQVHLPRRADRGRIYCRSCPRRGPRGGADTGCAHHCVKKQCKRFFCARSARVAFTVSHATCESRATTHISNLCRVRALA